MKNIKIWMLLLLLGFTGAGCDKDFDEINTNPNDPEEVPLTNVLVSGISQGVRRIHGASFDMTYAGLWAQHYAKIQYIDEDWYEYRPDALDAHWQGLYAGPLMDLTDILNRAPNPSNMRAAAMVMRAYYFSVITDMWGDVPYSEALNIDRVTTPKYDKQSDVYAALITELRTAASMFDASGDALGAGDVIYNGDVNKWRKFANSLRARMLNHAKHKDAAYASELQTLLSNPADLIASNDENAQMSYFDATADGSNPLYNNKYNDGRNDHAVSETMVTILQNDPRLPVYAELADGGVYKGQPNGTAEPVPFTSVSQIGAAFRDDPTAPSVLMTYAEVLFIIAEANGNKQAYLDGISASCAQHGVAADQAFLDAKSAEYDANSLDAIITQKWIALFGNGAEAFTEFRRTGFPNEIQEVPGTSYPGSGVPRRFPYATLSESGNNKANVEAAIQAQHVDASGLFGDKMWWAL
ncbi:MAG TPA: SusD/RagB family nutrient-binding outer membrane lipoprotein [Saprospiraceae bacterium]|nr:SusD/RagB family nutrient-binding outer membrane lipoprotein [Saprospiraceae bacterium]HNM24064.1 SusD/RagB family nutrient-binding outer membrane lipoprotein [Saprospiraceae bacterium]